jgi:nitrite reductase/ring-hydroxylating ferredoxin subunit
MKKPLMPSRRRFLERIFAATVVTATAPSVVLGRIVPSLRLTNGALAGRFRIDLTLPAYAKLRTVGGSLKLASMAGVGYRVIVTRTDETTFVAVDATCTHEGCVVNAVTSTSNGLLVCQCHGSRFAPDGALRNGPAQRPLAMLETFYDGASIVEIEIPQLASSDEEIASGAFVGSPHVDVGSGVVTIDIVLERATTVRADIYTTAGRRVAIVADANLSAGEHLFRASLDGLASGAYLFSIDAAGSGVISRRFFVAR